MHIPTHWHYYNQRQLSPVKPPGSLSNLTCTYVSTTYEYLSLFYTLKYIYGS